MSEAILITGTSSGFGRLAVQTLLRKGHRVVASMRDPDGRNQAVSEELASAGAGIVEIDVTDEGSVERGVSAAIEQVGDLGVLVNNAGIGAVGLQEAFTPDDWQGLFDINVFGVQRMSRAVIPHLRRRGSGLLLQVSSLLGRVTIPFYGPYNASKWAVEAMTENYRTELSAFGIDACIVEPGGFPTAFMDRLLRPADGSRDGDYGTLAGAPAQALAGFEQVLASNRQQDPQLVADAIAQLVETPAGQRPFRTVVDRLGMGEPIAQYNDHLARVTQGIYTAFGTEHMLRLQG